MMTPIDFRMRGKNTIEVSGCRQMFGYQHSLKYLLCSIKTQNRFGTSFWVNYPFKKKFNNALVIPHCPKVIPEQNKK